MGATQGKLRKAGSENMGSGSSRNSSRNATPTPASAARNSATPPGDGDTPPRASSAKEGKKQKTLTAPKEQKEDSNQRQKQELRSNVSVEPRDVMISYSHADKVIMQKLKDSLEAAGITVWVDVTGLKAGVDFLSKIGQAIIDAKLFISLLSETTIKSKYCQDELALAYVSNKPIFPVGLKQPQDLFPQMDTGMKLQLARFQWYLFLDDATYDGDVASLVSKLKESLAEETAPSDVAPHTVPNTPAVADWERCSNVVKLHRASTKKKIGRAKLVRQQTNSHLLPKAGIMSDRMLQKMDEKTNKFWDKHFEGRDYVDWETFLATFLEDYAAPLELTFEAGDRDWVVTILEREFEVEDNEGKVTRDMYNEFCRIADTEELQPLWYAVQDKAVENYTMREVFKMESTVRVEAIENLGKFRSRAVIEALLDLLTDGDKNVCAVAAISLARTGADGPRVEKRLMKCLNDKDRLVRESGCLALGHLKCEKAVPQLVQLWRNDFISHVREAAAVALEQIGGEEANKAMHMTRVLAEEIRTLTEE